LTGLPNEMNPLSASWLGSLGGLASDAAIYSPKVEETNMVPIFSFLGETVLKQVGLKHCQSLGVKPSYAQIEKQ